MNNIPVACSSVLVLCLVLCLACLHSCHAQAYHFSHGWFPGKKRSSAPPATKADGMDPFSHGASSFSSSPSSSSSSSEGGAQLSGPADSAVDSPLDFYAALQQPSVLSAAWSLASRRSRSCHLRPQVQQLIMDLIEVEVKRMVADCKSTTDHMTDHMTKKHHSNLSLHSLTQWLQREKEMREARSLLSSESLVDEDE